ncbi:MAG: zf-TFIIB domain-containing protein [Elusimicrobia bacterium]|nr:zf-TFIIB domain-containing protein [Elusimicrobiota bacterium]
MNCPKCPDTPLESCTIPLKDRSIPGPDATTRMLEMDLCPSCGGAWFDKDELDFYIDEKAVPVPPMARTVDPAADAKPGNCPRCARAMEKKPAISNPAVTVDGCAGCGGIWLDAGELERAAAEGIPLKDRLKEMFGDLGGPPRR